MDTKKLALSGKVFTYDRDHNILASIKTTNLVETNFQTISPLDSLRSIVNLISKAQRNIFPVTDTNNQLVGIIILDNIRDIIFKTELYDKILAKDVMIMPPAIISPNESMESVMKKFDQTGAWNLPVIDNQQYIGFISKSAVFSTYRTKLIKSTIA